MADLRQYKSTLFEAVRREREADRNWTWRVHSIGKKSAKIGWGYLDYIEEGTFEIELREDEFEDGTETSVVGKFPDGTRKSFSWVGDKIWNDAKTIEEAILHAVHGLAFAAHSEY